MWTFLMDLSNTIYSNFQKLVHVDINSFQKPFCDVTNEFYIFFTNGN